MIRVITKFGSYSIYFGTGTPPGAADSTSPLAGEHRDSERVLGEAGVPFTVLRNGCYTEGYTGQIGEYLEAGEIVGAAGHGRISAAPRRDYAGGAAAATSRPAART